MKLTLPEPQIRLYEDGLAAHDKLDRKPIAKQLSYLVENIADPLVIALDGGWGSGKSTFLKCWVGEHLKEQAHKAHTLYFDAFENDYLEDPLIALTGALTDRLEQVDRKPELLKKLRTAAYRIAPMAARIGLAAVTVGGTELAGAVGDAVIEASSENVEKAAEAYWKREDGRRAAMGQFRAALKSLTDPDGNDAPQKRMVIVIDELDRCRPDYALQLLEVIKHFFATPGVHFVLGVNMHELANSVRARYGAGIDADRYLHKFVQIRVPMKLSLSKLGSATEASKHFKYVAEQLSIHSLWHQYFDAYFEMLNDNQEITLRDVQKIAALLVITNRWSLDQREEYWLYAGLLIIQVLKSTWISRLRRGEIAFQQINQFFDLDRHKEKREALGELAHSIGSVLWSAHYTDHQPQFKPRVLEFAKKQPCARDHRKSPRRLRTPRLILLPASPSPFKCRSSTRIRTKLDGQQSIRLFHGRRVQNLSRR
ncbi:P-loop NTPase fold protein [Loktanella agnita]|uniref:KAP family P-loop NTPase fold protein n=1 Tax=Loktanella agnita TaxID=287097 RepID=UPI0039892979